MWFAYQRTGSIIIFFIKILDYEIAAKTLNSKGHQYETGIGRRKTHTRCSTGNRLFIIYYIDSHIIYQGESYATELAKQNKQTNKSVVKKEFK